MSFNTKGDDCVTYEELLEEATENGINVIEKSFKSNAKGLCKGNKIAIRKELPTVAKRCILAEEIGHYETTVGNILDQSVIGNAKQEEKARRWAYDKLISQKDIVRAFAAGYRQPHEIAEHLGVSEEFLRNCIDYHQVKNDAERRAKIEQIAFTLGAKTFYIKDEKELLQILETQTK